MKIVILERASVGLDVSVDMFQEIGEVEIYNNTLYKDIAKRVENADIIIANKSKLNEETLKNALNVKLICEFATGFDNVDIEYCKKRKIGVCNVRDYSTDMVAQHTFALAFYLSEKLEHYDMYVKSGRYGSQDRFSNFDIPFYELDKKTWGVVGLGNIGRRVARIADSFGCRVITHSVTGSRHDDSPYEQVDKDTLLKESDYISLHCPLSDLSRGFIDADALAAMKETAVLINVARGPVVDSAALADALENGKIAGAGLDVLEHEPIGEDDPLGKIKDSNRLIITPHLAWASVEARTRCVEEVYLNLKAFMNGEDRNAVL